MTNVPVKNYNKAYLLGKLHEPISTGAHNSAHGYLIDPRYAHQFPYFNYQSIRTMLLDSRVKYGLSLLKGPVTTYTKFFTSKEADSPEIHDAIVELNYHFPYGVFADEEKVEQFIIDQLNRFWEVGLSKALTALEWGYSGSEIAYKEKNGKLNFSNLYLYPYNSLQVVTKNRGIIGFTRNRDKTSYVPLGKGFWHVHNRHQNHYYGESVLKGSHVPWHEMWSLGGGRDIRRQWFFKNAYDGGELYYPEGSFQDSNGNVITHEEHAAHMLELKRSGASIMFPSTKGIDGKRNWEYEKPQGAVTPGGMEEYLQALRDEILEGLGIPPEVVQSDEGGLGSSTGRMVPLMAFIASLTPIGAHIIGDFNEQIMPILLQEYGYTGDWSVRRIVPKTYEAPYDYSNGKPLDADMQFGKPGPNEKAQNPNVKAAEGKTVQGKNKTP